LIAAGELVDWDRASSTSCATVKRPINERCGVELRKLLGNLRRLADI
jgi:hypothetical protein